MQLAGYTAIAYGEGGLFQGQAGPHLHRREDLHSAAVARAEGHGPGEEGVWQAVGEHVVQHRDAWGHTQQECTCLSTGDVKHTQKGRACGLSCLRRSRAAPHPLLMRP